MDKRYQEELIAFGNRLKAIRLKKGLSQLDLEIESGINRTEISKIENGIKNIEFVTIIRLADALNIGVIEFFKNK